MCFVPVFRWNIIYVTVLLCELSYSLNEIGAFQKLRWTLGTEWKLSKKHALDFYYLYQNKADDDEANGHVIGAGYSFKF